MTPPQPEPEPPTQGGQDRGKWALDTQYQPGDIFTYEGQRYRVKKAHESNFILSPENISYAGEIHDYLERI